MADTTKLSPAAQRMLNNASTINERIIIQQMSELTPEHYRNYNSILSKYPNMSRDVVMALVGQGLNANTPGIDKISSLDGISQLKADSVNLTKFQSVVKKDSSLLGKVKDAFSNVVYDPFKGATRLTFAALRSPYDYLTTVGRDVYSVATNPNAGAAMRLLKDLNPATLAGETTQFGQLTKAMATGKVDTGAGFFISPESKVGKAQAEAMSKYGMVNGQSFTIGRGVAYTVGKAIGQDPDYYGYSVMSGLIDATLNIATDPSSWIPAGALSKVVRGGKVMKVAGETLPRKVTLKEMKERAAEVGRLKETFAGEALKEARKTNKAISKIRTRYADDYLKAELELQNLNKVKADAQYDIASKTLDAERTLYKNFSTSKEARDTLKPENIAQWVITNPGVQNGALLRGLSQASADLQNTGGMFAGAMHLDTIPVKGQISVGAHGLDEFAVTYVGKSAPKLVDLADNLSTASTKELAAEVTRRSKLMEFFYEQADNFDNSPATREIYQTIHDEFVNAMRSGSGPVGSVLFGKAEYTLGQIIARVMDFDSDAVNRAVSTAIQNIWKADGFTNIRSIYGETGGIAISNPKLLAARKVEITSAIAEIVDPNNLAPNVSKLIDGIQDIDTSIGAAETKFAEAAAEKAKFEQQIKDVNLFRDYANQDPEVLARIINDPDYKDLRKIIKMNIKVADKDILAEWYNTEVGLTNAFGGTLAKDFSLPLRFMLGNKFAEIAKIVAAETNPSKIRNFFGKKLDASIVKELTDATNENQVYSVFLKYLGQEGTDPNIFRSPSLRMQATQLKANPLVKMIDPINMRAIKLAQNTEKSFGRYYVRSATLNLGDTESCIQGLENWAYSGGLHKILGKENLDVIVSNTVTKLFDAATEQQRGKIVTDAVGEMLTGVLGRLNLPKGRVVKVGSEELSLEEVIKNTIRVSGRDKALIEVYSNARIGTNEVPTMFFTGKGMQQLPGQMQEWQLLQETLRLPDSKEVLKIVNKAATNNQLYGRAKAAKILAGELGDIWRTAMLVGRLAFIARNVGEMQMRQFFSGHATLINHPAQFIAMVMADPNGGKIGKFANRYSRYKNNVLGQEFKNLDAEYELGDSVRQYSSYMNRMVSANDMRGREVAKYYQISGPEAPSYFKDLAYTVNRMYSDKFNSDIALMLINGSGDVAKREYIAKLVDTLDQPNNPLANYAASIFDKNVNLRNVIFKNPKLENPILKDNINQEDLFTLFFDEMQPDSFASQIKAVAGSGEKSNHILELIAKGKTTIFDKSGKATVIETGWGKSLKTVEQLVADETRFKTLLSKTFSRDELTNSRVWTVKEKLIGGQDTKMLNGFVDGFFRLSAQAENKLNFGPEFQMSYWDHIARYADMLDTPELKEAYRQAVKALSPITVKGKPLGLGQAPLKVIRKEIRRRESMKAYKHTGGVSLKTLDGMASENAALHIKDLFYDASRQRNWAAAWRLVFPFAQAQGNTMFKWAQLAAQNPVPIYRFGKAYDALTKPGSSVIYDIFGMAHDSNQGFVYKDEQGNESFKYPIVGSVIGALAGMDLSGKDALQLTGRVQSLNLAFGQVNPVLPGLGPAASIAFVGSGKSQLFGPGFQILRDIITPFGEPKNAGDIVFPAWLNKIIAYRLGNSELVQRDTKDWASYLASTGNYGENPLANDAARTKMFQDAESLARWAGFMTSFFQSVLPATPSQEIVAKIKSPDNKVMFMTMTMLFNAWQGISEKHPGDFGAAKAEFADTFGIQNLLITLGGSTRAVRGTQDAWNFLNNNPGAAEKYARGVGDVVPYFFPGGEYSISYYNWQKRTGLRTALTKEQLASEAERLVYDMMLSRIAEQQVANQYPQWWYNEQVTKLNSDLGAVPPETILSGGPAEKIARVGEALNDPAFKQSPVYEETKEFYDKYSEYQRYLNEVRGSVQAQFTAKSAYASLLRTELTQLAERLMQQKPEFARMYYGVFSGQLKG